MVSVESLSLTLEGTNNVHGSDSLTTSVVSVGSSILHHGGDEDTENTTDFLIHETGDTLNTSSSGETADGGLGNTIDGVTEHLAMSLGTTLS